MASDCRMLVAVRECKPSHTSVKRNDIIFFGHLFHSNFSLALYNKFSFESLKNVLLRYCEGRMYQSRLTFIRE